jgi:hypothetical protein
MQESKFTDCWADAGEAQKAVSVVIAIIPPIVRMSLSLLSTL